MRYRLAINPFSTSWDGKPRPAPGSGNPTSLARTAGDAERGCTAAPFNDPRICLKPQDVGPGERVHKPVMSILSIQSHVAYGHVGNASAVFPLQRLGFEVWPIHTVQFSNHVGYEDWEGTVFSPEQIRKLVDGIERRGVFAGCEAVLSGYMGDAATSESVLYAVERVRAHNPRALYNCDPVMGDVGIGLYVTDGIPEEMRGRTVPAANIITPNQFELELLTGRTITTLDDAVAAARQALAMGPEVVLLTSLRHAATRPGTIGMLAVTADACWQVETPYLAMDPMPHGSGDAVSALFLGHYLRAPAGPGRVETALGLAAQAIFAIMNASAKAGGTELALVAAQDEIAAPSRRFPVERLA